VRTPRGRVATVAAWHHLGLEPPVPRTPGPAATATTLFDA
jgi:holliday junction DNA helicase RuvB